MLYLSLQLVYQSARHSVNLVEFEHLSPATFDHSLHLLVLLLVEETVSTQISQVILEQFYLVSLLFDDILSLLELRY